MFFWNSLGFLMIQQMLTIWSLVPQPFLKPAWTSGSSWFTYCWSLSYVQLFCNPMDCSLLSFFVHGISQAEILEWGAISFSRGSSQPRDQTWVSHIVDRYFYHLSHQGSFTSVWDECNCAVVWAFFGIAFLWDCNKNWPFPVLWPLLSFPNLLAYWA